MFAVTWQYVLFDEEPTLLPAAGMTLNNVSVVLLGLKKRVASPPDSEGKEEMSCLAGHRAHSPAPSH